MKIEAYKDDYGKTWTREPHSLYVWNEQAGYGGFYEGKGLTRII